MHRDGSQDGGDPILHRSNLAFTFTPPGQQTMLPWTHLKVQVYVRLMFYA